MKKIIFLSLLVFTTCRSVELQRIPESSSRAVVVALLSVIQNLHTSGRQPNGARLRRDTPVPLYDVKDYIDIALERSGTTDMDTSPIFEYVCDVIKSIQSDNGKLPPMFKGITLSNIVDPRTLIDHTVS